MWLQSGVDLQMMIDKRIEEDDSHLCIQCPSTDEMVPANSVQHKFSYLTKLQI